MPKVTGSVKCPVQRGGANLCPPVAQSKREKWGENRLQLNNQFAIQMTKDIGELIGINLFSLLTN